MRATSLSVVSIIRVALDGDQLRGKRRAAHASRELRANNLDCLCRAEPSVLHRMPAWPVAQGCRRFSTLRSACLTTSCRRQPIHILVLALRAQDSYWVKMRLSKKSTKSTSREYFAGACTEATPERE